MSKVGPAGFSQLLNSKKGVAFTGTATAIAGMMLEGAISAQEGGRLLVALAAAHMLAQGIADAAKALRPAPPQPCENSQKKTSEPPPA